MRNLCWISGIVLSIVLSSCSNLRKDNEPFDYVNPFVGTDAHGHTYPGAIVPFGMVQLSPDTRLDGWDGCSGYHFSDSIIYGFTHTHLSGTGVSDYADVLLMPVNQDDSFDKNDYASKFFHSKEKAQPGYYSVYLEKPRVNVELTATERVGIHRYTFNGDSEPQLLIDLIHRDEVIGSELNIVNDSTIEGYRISKAWATQQTLFFRMVFSKPMIQKKSKVNGSISNLKQLKGKDIQTIVSFNQTNDPIIVRVSISSVDANGAALNLKSEAEHVNFEQYRQSAKRKWQNALGKVKIIDPNAEKKKVFYTALYHTMIVPNIFSDVDGRYRGLDNQIHRTKQTQYTVFSLWDTYRATHPLYTILETERTKDFVETFKNQFEQGGSLPVWELWANETGCMIGYHSVPVITDAYLKGLISIPADTLLKMMMHSANQDHLGLKAYKENGYISIEDDAESVSKTLEYAFDDWCIAQVAQHAQNDSIYKTFIRRAQNYKNVFDPESGFMRAKLNDTWKTPFDPKEVDFNYTEANAWQYSFAVPQDIETLIQLMGGANQFEQKLDLLFTESTQTTGREQSDITGLIGQYAHGNEPSHHIAYLYQFVGKPEKTQHYVNRIIDDLYSSKPDGLCGNEDCGQMSAWYVFSALGLYPVNPASGMYVWTVPQFEKSSLLLDNGNTFTISKIGSSDKNAKVQSVSLNGQKINRNYIKHTEMMSGGELIFEMISDQSYKPVQWVSVASKIDDELISVVPSFIKGQRAFRDSTVLAFSMNNSSAPLYYQINQQAAQLYQHDFTIDETSEIKFWTEDSKGKNKIHSSKFYKIPTGKTITLQNLWHPQYSAGGNDALIDGLEGTLNFRTGAWQGYYFSDLVALIDFGKPTTSTYASINFIQDLRSWIWMPPYVEFFGSNNGEYFFPLGKVFNDVPETETNVVIKKFSTSFYPKSIRYLKVYAKNELLCPKWHGGAGSKAFIFADEIIVK